MRLPLPDWPTRRARHSWGVAILTGLTLAFLPAMPTPLYADHGPTTVSGQIRNGTAGEAAPAGLEVILHTFGVGGGVDVASVLTSGDGSFEFQGLEVEDSSSYAVTTNYQEVMYSMTLEPSSLDKPVELLVYETTGSLADVHVGVDILLLSRPEQDEESLDALDVVSVVNSGDRTFVPSLDDPGSMSFLRFSLPAAATSPDIASDLAGGDIIDVGTGFALTAPVPPGSHRVSYTYRLPYEGSRLEFTHSFPMGAEAFRLLLEDGIGNLLDPSFLTRVAENGQGTGPGVWGASQILPGTRLNVEIDGLPQPSFLSRTGDALTDGPYLKVGIPAVVGLMLAGLLVYALFLRQPVGSLAVNTGSGSGGSVQVEGASDETAAPNSDRRALVEAIAGLDDLFQRGEVAQKDYERRRQDLKTRLVELTGAKESR